MRGPFRQSLTITNMKPLSSVSRNRFIVPIILCLFGMRFLTQSASAWSGPMIPYDYDVKTDGAIRVGTTYGANYVSPKIELPGRLYVPGTYASGTSFALVIYYHGSGQQYQYTSGTGTYMDRHVSSSNFDNLMKSATNNQFFVYAPQDPDQYEWAYENIVRAMAMVKQATRDYPKIDTKRIYVTGLSLGGRGCRATVANFADVIAAAVPICSDMGDGEQDFYGMLVDKPIWAFHARDDTSVPVSASRNLVKWIRQAAGKSYPWSWPISNGTSNKFYNDGYPYFTGTNATVDTSGYVTTHLSWIVWLTGSANVPAFDTSTLIYTEFASGQHGIWDEVFNEGIPNYTGGGSNSKKYPLYNWLLSQNLAAGLPAALQTGETLLFDFGATNCCPSKDGTSTGFYWNGTLAGDEQTKGVGATGSNNRVIIPYAVTSEGKRTPVTMELVGIFGGTGTTGYTGSGVPYINAQTTSDYWLTKAYATGTTDAGIMRFSGLGSNKSYEIRIWASNTTLDGANARYTRYEINGATRDLDVYDYSGTNNYPMATFSSVASGSDGCLDVKVYPKPGTNSRYGVINTLELKAVPTPLEDWRQTLGLASDGSQDLEMPAGDGVSNLVKYALNLAVSQGDLQKPAYQMVVGGSAGLPRFDRPASNTASFTFVRRRSEINPGVLYIPQQSDDLVAWTPCAEVPSVVSIDGTWERVTYTQDVTNTPKRFLRLGIVRP